jgi:sporulation protein YlmC with PRC-barrel domain
VFRIRRFPAQVTRNVDESEPSKEPSLILIVLLNARLAEKHVAKVLMTTAFAATAATAVLVIYAPPRAIFETDAGVIQPDQVRASKMLGRAVYSARNVRIGTLKELVLDKEGRVAAAVVDVTFDGFGDKYVAVHMTDITTSNNHLTLDRTRDQLQQMTSYKFEIEHEGAGSEAASPISAGR